MFQGNLKGSTQIPKAKKIEQYFFSYQNKIGEGRFSNVYRGIDENLNMPIAVKVIQLSSLKTKTARFLLQNQISILKDLNHKNIIKCLDVITSVNNCYIIFELCQGKDLEKLLHQKKRFEQQQLLKIIYDVYNGLLYLQSSQIVHRDLKIANIFIGKDNQTKIADFGFATKAKSYFKDICIGSPVYMSPQGLVANVYSPKTDVWSFGVMIYELIHGEPPLAYCKTQEELKQQSILPAKITASISNQLKDFIKLCLAAYPQQRPSIKDLSNTLFMKKVFQKMGVFQIPKHLIQTGHTMDSTTRSQNAKMDQVSHQTSQISSMTEMQIQPAFQKAKPLEQDKNLLFYKNILKYQEAVALIDYCRLIYKTCKINHSKILIQWLLFISLSLSKAKIDQNGSKYNKIEKLFQVIRQYNQKYTQQYQILEKKTYQTTIDHIISQCKQMKKTTSTSMVSIISHNSSFKNLKSSPSFYSFSSPVYNLSPKSKSYISVLLKQSEQLKKCLLIGKYDNYPKVTQVDHFLKQNQ